MKTTALELNLLICIKKYTEECFGSDEGYWAYIIDMCNYYNLDLITYRGVISSLIKKGIVKIDSIQNQSDIIVINEDFRNYVDSIQ